MILLSVTDVAKHYGDNHVLAGVTFDVRPGERISLVGTNGSGKTTLLRILAGYEEPDGGGVERHPSARLGYLEQQARFEPDRTLWETARGGLADLLALAHEADATAAQIGASDSEEERLRLSKRLDALHEELHRRDGYHVEHRIERVLMGVGFRRDEFQRPVGLLSGGQQNRLMLARLLLEEPDVMLLDEPSNHLDLEAVSWLEEHLASSSQAMIVVSHDRYLLDKVATRTLELFDGTVESYAGNYSAYTRQKAERLEVQRRTYERQQAEIARLDDFIRRNQYGQKHAQAEDRRKKKERIVPVPRPRIIEAPPMSFGAAARTGDIVLRVERLNKGFDRPLVVDATFDILRGQKWGVLGPNGCGKTTLLRCIVGQQPPDSGSITLGTGVRVGYFDQLLACLEPGVALVEAVRTPDKQLNVQQRRDMLARFGITGDAALQSVESLSGGQLSRAALAMLASSEANLLLLDEPTNHLDLWARSALEDSLKEYDGTVLFVSHDRYFVNRVADHLLVFEDGRCRVIEGGYDTYLHLRAVERDGQSSAREAAQTAKSRGSISGRSGSARSGSRSGRDDGEMPERRKWRFPYRSVEQLESDIADRENEIEELHQALGSSEVLRDGRRVKELAAQLKQQQEELASLYEHWEEAIERNAR